MDVCTGVCNIWFVFTKGGAGELTWNDNKFIGPVNLVDSGLPPPRLAETERAGEPDFWRKRKRKNEEPGPPPAPAPVLIQECKINPGPFLPSGILLLVTTTGGPGSRISTFGVSPPLPSSSAGLACELVRWRPNHGCPVTPPTCSLGLGLTGGWFCAPQSHHTLDRPGEDAVAEATQNSGESPITLCFFSTDMFFSPAFSAGPSKPRAGYGGACVDVVFIHLRLLFFFLSKSPSQVNSPPSRERPLDTSRRPISTSSSRPRSPRPTPLFTVEPHEQGERWVYFDLPWSSSSSLQEYRICLPANIGALAPYHHTI